MPSPGPPPRGSGSKRASAALLLPAVGTRLTGYKPNGAKGSPFEFGSEAWSVVDPVTGSSEVCRSTTPGPGVGGLLSVVQIHIRQVRSCVPAVVVGHGRVPMQPTQPRMVGGQVSASAATATCLAEGYEDVCVALFAHRPTSTGTHRYPDSVRLHKRTVVSAKQFEPRLVPLNAEGCVIAGQLVLNHGSIIGPSLRIVGQNDHTVAR